MLDKDLHKGHRLRLKSKFERVGLDGFEDHEVLEYLLTFAIPQRDVNPLAHQLINHFGSFNGVLDADPIELRRVDGVGPHATALLTLIPQLAKRYLDNPAAAKRYSMARSEDRKSYFIPKFVGKTKECLYVAFLNNAWDVLDCSMLEEGVTDAMHVDIRKILDVALKVRATAVVLAHNHLGHGTPSSEDIVTTNFIAEKLALCEITLVDHIVVHGDSAVSMAACGQIRHVR